MPFRTLIVPAANVTLARSISASYGSMWTTGLSASGSDPATHYVSTGIVPAAFVMNTPLQAWEYSEPDGWSLVSSDPGDPVAVYTAAEAGGVVCTQEDVNDLFAASDFTEQPPFVAFDRLGLKIVQEPI